MATSVKITTIGNSVGIVLPKEVLNRLHVEKGDMLYLTESPEGDRLPKTRGMSRAAAALKRKAFHPPLAIDFDKCTHCGECDTGCRVGAKNTLDRNYLEEVDARDGGER